MSIRTISLESALVLINRQESQFWDHKSSESNGATVEKIAVALANADGGEFILGIVDERQGEGIDRWRGFETIEASNYVQQALISGTTPPVPYSYEFLVVEGRDDLGIACLVRIEKSIDVHFTSANKAFIRAAATSTPLLRQQVTDLQLSKGAKSYEDQRLAEYTLPELLEEHELNNLLGTLAPTSTGADFVRRERLAHLESQECRVAAAVLFSENPPAVVPRRCGIKISRYETTGAPQREFLAGRPLSVEGPARPMVEDAIRCTVEMLEAVQIMQPDGSLAPMRYPTETLKEIIVNAVIHRDYNMPDDVHIMIFDNRVEIKSPGGLPGHMTLALLFKERASRNPKILRLLNKYPVPLNQDIGEGLRTAREKMIEAKLKAPKFAVEGNYFLVTLPHERLARPEEIVLEYLESHDEITNRIARHLTGITSENSMKEVFYQLKNVGKLELVPGKGGNKAAWRLTGNDSGQLSFLEEPLI